MKNNIFRIVTGIAGAYHVLLGVIGLLFPIETMVKAVTIILGVTLDVDPQLTFISKYVSVYILAFGIMLLILAANPTKYRVLALPALALFGIRLLNRIVFFGAITSTLGTTSARNIMGTGFIFLFFIAILLTMPKKQS